MLWGEERKKDRGGRQDGLRGTGKFQGHIHDTGGMEGSEIILEFSMDFLKELKLAVQSDPAVHLLGVFPEEFMMSDTHTDNRSRMICNR